MHRVAKISLLLITYGFVFIMTGCLGAESEAERPIQFAFVPSVEAEAIELELEEFDSRLSEMIGHPVESDVVLNYTACIEQMGAGRTDVAMLPSLAYVLASERYGVEVQLKAVRKGTAMYRGEIITRSDSGIESVEDLVGRTFSFTDAASTSGHLYPKSMLIDNGIDPDNDLAEYDFLGGHTAVVTSVYQGRVDAGACFDDARIRMEETYPDIMDQIVVIGYTEWIPADTVSFRSGLDEELVTKLVDALIELSKEEDSIMYRIYQIEELVPAADSDYDEIRDKVAQLEYDIESGLE